MNYAHTLLLTSVSAFILLGGCRKDEPTSVDLGHDYFPTRIGSWIEYHVDSLRVRNDTLHTWSYDIREVLAETFTDPEGRPAQRVIRYTRGADDTWLPKDVWWQTRDHVRAERCEENQRCIKLVFPPRSWSYWNANAANPGEEFELTYEDIDVPWSTNGLYFDSTVLVVGTYENNLVNTKRYEERYAKHIGLVYREVDSSNTQSTTFDRYKVVYAVTATSQ